MKIVSLGTTALWFGLTSCVIAGAPDRAPATATVEVPLQLDSSYLQGPSSWKVTRETSQRKEKTRQCWQFFEIDTPIGNLIDLDNPDNHRNFLTHVQASKTGAGSSHLDLEYKDDQGKRWVRPGIIMIETNRLVWVYGPDVEHHVWARAPGKVPGRPTSWAAPAKGNQGGRLYLEPMWR